MKARFINLDNIVLEAKNEIEAIMMKNFYTHSNQIYLDDWVFDVDDNENVTKFTISSQINIKSFANERGIKINVEE